MGYLDFLYSGFKNLKDYFHNYQARTSGYEAHQYVSSGNDSGPVFMETVTDSIVDTFAYGGFALANLICYEKKYFESYFCQKKTVSFDAYYIDEYDMKNSEDDDDNEYHLVDEYDLGNEKYDLEEEMNDADLLSAYIEEYGAEDEECDTGVLSEDKTEYPPARTLDDSWGFIDSGNLSVEFKNTTVAPKGPRKMINFSLLILAQAKKDYFKKLASKPKQNLTRQNRTVARISAN
ncbi:hypothetical protein MFLAVUS_006938 [Mucor flavus]|uniref:Uncharacterized protein n=1 Tax=Mucor flavus TaxID=439312 RepID=A0ABP9Z2X8_9FUNG